MVLIPPERQSQRIRSTLPNAIVPVPDTPSSRKRVARVPTFQKPSREVDSVEEQQDDDFAEPDDSDDDGTTFKSRSALPMSSVHRWKLSELVERLDNGLIDLNAEYQRDVVWMNKSMSGLINSLVEDYYIPPLIFNPKVSRQPDGSDIYRRVCVDGKQRLSSVQKFMHGLIPCFDKHGKEWYFCDSIEGNGEGKPKSHKPKRRIWSNQLRQQFSNKALVSYEYKELSFVQEEDLFARVQKGMPLTAAEKLHASSGVWQNFAKECEQKYANVVALSVQSRGKGFSNILTAFAQITEVQNPSNNDGTCKVRIQMPSVTNMVNKQPDLLTAANKSHMKEVFATFSELVSLSPKTFQNNNYKVARNFAPIELVAVGVLISLYMDTRNNTMLIGDIEAMRETIREHLPDLRMDNITWKSIWQFIAELESFRGATTTTRKKNFEISKVTERERLRIRAAGETTRAPTTSSSTDLTYATSSSAQVSSRSTPATSLAPTASSVTSPRSIPVIRLSTSIDSVLGDPYEYSSVMVSAPGDTSAVTAPEARMRALPMLPSNPLQHDISNSLTPVVKQEMQEPVDADSSQKTLSSGFSGASSSLADDLRARRAKRRKMEGSRSSDVA